MSIIAIAIVAAAAAPVPALSPTDTAAAFNAAGFTRKAGQWRSDCDDPGTSSYSPGEIQEVRDLNGDGLPEAIITEGGTFCYGHAGAGFMLVGKTADGKWVKLHSSQGIATILPTRANGWPEIEVGGPGFCFPVLRWDGKAFADHRTQYEGKPCRR